MGLTAFSPESSEIFYFVSGKEAVEFQASNLTPHKALLVLFPFFISFLQSRLVFLGNRIDSIYYRYKIGPEMKWTQQSVLFVLDVIHPTLFCYPMLIRWR